MFAAGVRAHYHASQRAAPSMVARGRGLIVNISFWAAQKHIGNVAYGVAKAATDTVMEAAQWLDLSNSESPEFIGRAVVALASDPHVMRYTGRVFVAAALAQEFGFSDTGGAQPRPLTLDDV